MTPTAQSAAGPTTGAAAGPAAGAAPGTTGPAPGATGQAPSTVGPAPSTAGPAPGAATGPPAAAAAAPEEARGSATGEAAHAAAAAPTAWTAVVSADRAHYNRVIAAGGPDAATMAFPAYCPQRSFRLTGAEMRIGRRSVSRGISPEIDLSGPPLDPGISRLHAVLTAQPGGGWAVVDVGSENGTLVNGSELATGVPVQLREGDRINLGAWTAITITADGGGPPAAPGAPAAGR